MVRILCVGTWISHVFTFEYSVFTSFWMNLFIRHGANASANGKGTELQVSYVGQIRKCSDIFALMINEDLLIEILGNMSAVYLYWLCVQPPIFLVFKGNSEHFAKTKSVSDAIEVFFFFTSSKQKTVQNALLSIVMAPPIDFSFIAPSTHYAVDSTFIIPHFLWVCIMRRQKCLLDFKWVIFD